MRKHYLKIGVMVIALVGVLRAHPTFAADTVASDDTAGVMTLVFNELLKFLSRGWMLLAFLAGKLMSNDFVYGTFIHLDSALFKLWNYMKNIANFLIGFLFLFEILRSFFTKDTFNITKTLPRFLVAGVLIQMSRFIMGGLVDLSNIATAAVGSFPSQFLQSSTDNLSESKMNQMAVTVPVKVDVTFKGTGDVFTSYTGNQNIQDMFGKFNDMSGPLMFMGASIFRFQDYDIVNQDITNRKNFTIGLFLKLFMLFAFTVPLLVLIVINLIRIFKLRLWVIFSPLAAITRSFDEKQAPGFLKNIGSTKQLGFGKFTDVIGLIFQPVVMIGSLSLVMILSIGMYYVLGGDPGNQQGDGGTYSETIENTQISADTKGSTLKDLTSGTEITIEGDLFKNVGNFVGGMIGYLILTGFTAVLLWSLIKISASFSTFTKDISNKIFDGAEKLVTNTNIIPFGAGKTSIAALGKAKDDTVSRVVNAGYADKNITAETKNLSNKFYGTAAGSKFKSVFGINDAIEKDIARTERTELINASRSGVNGILASLRKSLQGKQVSAQSSNLKSGLAELMSNNEPFKKFMLEGAGITDPKDYEDNKDDILNASNEVGAKMRNFLAYALNKSDLKASDRIPESEKIKVFLRENLKVENVLSSTPLMPQQQAPKE